MGSHLDRLTVTECLIARLQIKHLRFLSLVDAIETEECECDDHSYHPSAEEDEDEDDEDSEEEE